MNHQEIFEKVKAHLLSQNAKSLTEDGMCAYRGVGGLKCAVGCLISDDVYQPEMENHNVYYPEVEDALRDSGVKFNVERHESLNFFRELQAIHDGYPCSEWAKELETLRAKWGLQ